MAAPRAGVDRSPGVRGAGGRHTAPAASPPGPPPRPPPSPGARLRSVCLREGPGEPPGSPRVPHRGSGGRTPGLAQPSRRRRAGTGALGLPLTDGGECTRHVVPQAEAFVGPWVVLPREQSLDPGAGVCHHSRPPRPAQSGEAEAVPAVSHAGDDFISGV